ncbi:MAG: beta-glucanase (GH16 family) [Cyclobacteriaceae bacterium]|jgi:beta-glucanase (GH16 family)
MNRVILTNKHTFNGIIVAAVAVLWLLSNAAIAQIRVEAEDYDAMEGILTQQTLDAGGGLNVGWIDDGDWLSYDLAIPVTGDYALNIRYASQSGGGKLNVSIDDETPILVDMPATGGWQEWTTLQGPTLALTQGARTLTLVVVSGGYNLNRFELLLISPIDTDAPSTPEILSSRADEHTVELSWTQSSDMGSAVAGYQIFNGAQLLAYTTDSEYSIQKLAPQTLFSLSMVATDLAGNASDTVKLSIETLRITWPLSWSDEFDGTEVDRDKWNFQIGGGGWGNEESQYYTDGDNSRIENGELIIEVRQETIGTNDYTSSRMNTANKGDFLYGRVEVRAKLPSTGGTWPAIWTLPTDWIYGNWPDVGEIDIMEHSAHYDLNYVFATIHTKAYNHKDGTQFSGGKDFEDVVNTFHTYTLEWYPDRLDWYYDDIHVFTYDNPYLSLDEWPFDIPHHLLVNVAIGGGLGGEIDHDGVWPQQMVVDYVRMYDFELGAGDTTPPSEPSNLTGVVDGINVVLDWDISSDDQYVEKYYIFLDGNVVDSVSGSSYVLQCLKPESSVTVGVQARDFGGNTSPIISTNVTTEAITGIALTNRFEAEDFACVEGIETETCTDAGGGLNLAFIDAGDWVEYYIDVPERDTYYLFARVASLDSEGSFDLEDEAGNVLASVATPLTGGWQTWRSVVSDGFTLEAGIQKIRLRMTKSNFNINWLEFDTEVITATDDLFEDDLLVYPNPVTAGKLNIQLHETLAGPVGLLIYSLDGKIQHQCEQVLEAGATSINELALKPGVYTLHLRLPSGETQQQKLIIR